MTPYQSPLLVPGLLDESETAAILKCSLAKMRSDRFYRRGLPYVKLGRNVRYRLEDIQTYVDSHVVRHEKAADFDNTKITPQRSPELTHPCSSKLTHLAFAHKTDPGITPSN